MPPKGIINKCLGNRRPKKKSKISKILRRNNVTFNKEPKELKEPEETEEPEKIDDITETYEGTEKSGGMGPTIVITDFVQSMMEETAAAYKGARMKILGSSFTTH